VDDLLNNQEDPDNIVIPDDFNCDIPQEDIKHQLIVLKKVRSRLVDPALGAPTGSGSSRDQPKNEKSVREKRKEERKRKTEEEPSSSTPNPDRGKLMKMAREATQHHGDVLAKWQAAAPYYYFLTSIADSRPTHSEPLTITFTGAF